jgi:hypothetical protein
MEFASRAPRRDCRERLELLDRLVEAVNAYSACAARMAELAGGRDPEEFWLSAQRAGWLHERYRDVFNELKEHVQSHGC